MFFLIMWAVSYQIFKCAQDLNLHGFLTMEIYIRGKEMVPHIQFLGLVVSEIKQIFSLHLKYIF
jgi:hypothetical protein